MKLCIVGIMAICAMVNGDVSHLLPSANAINGLAGQYTPKPDSLLYLPPLQPQQQNVLQRVAVELPVELPIESVQPVAAPLAENSNESSAANENNSEVSVSVESAASPSLIRSNNPSEEQIDVRTNVQTSEAAASSSSTAVNVPEAIEENANELQQSAKLPNPYLPPLLESVVAPRVQTVVAEEEPESSLIEQLPPFVQPIEAEQEQAIPLTEQLAPEVSPAETNSASESPKATAATSESSSLSPLAFECNDVNTNQLPNDSADDVRQESRSSIATSDNGPIALPGAGYLPAKEDAKSVIAPVTTEAPIEVRVLVSEPESTTGAQAAQQSSTTQEAQPESSVTTASVELPSRQYLQPSSSVQPEEKSAAATENKVEPSHTFSEADGYKYKLPAKSFNF